MTKIACYLRWGRFYSICYLWGIFFFFFGYKRFQTSGPTSLPIWENNPRLYLSSLSLIERIKNNKYVLALYISSVFGVYY